MSSVYRSLRMNEFKCIAENERVRAAKGLDMEEIDDLKEYSSMNYCLSEIPVRVRKGLNIVDVKFLCIDAVEEFIAVGTNIGVVYWCNRIKNKIDRLRPEKCGPKITFVKVISSVDYMVAVGDELGAVSIFMIPKDKPVFLPTDSGKLLRKSIERFTVSDMHTSPVTSIEWSLNGQKLFTGDEKGLVVFTQVDFNLNIIKSSEILNEKFSIVQLSYFQPQMLLVASEYRCIIYNQAKEQKILQVGQKDRLNLCKLGAVIFCRTPSVGPMIYAARPKQRIWLANTEGCVEQTYLFKEAILKSHKVINLINDSASGSRTSINTIHQHEPLSQSHNEEYTFGSCFKSTSFSEMEFSNLKVYKNNFLLTYNSSALLLLNLEETSVIAGLYSVKKIISVAVNKDEIFVLDGYRRLRRIAATKDRYNFPKSNKDVKDSMIGDLLNLVNNIKEEASNSVVKPFIENLKKNDSRYGEFSAEPLSPAEDALIALAPEIQSTSSSNENEEGIVFNRKRKTTPISKKEDVIEVPSENISENSTTNVPSEGRTAHCVRFVSEQVQNLEHGEEKVTTSNTKEIPVDLLPDTRNIDSIMKDVEKKENLLAALLNFSIDKPSSVSDVCTTSSANSVVSEFEQPEFQEQEQSAEDSVSSNFDLDIQAELPVVDILENTESLNKYIDELFENHDHTESGSVENDSILEALEFQNEHEIGTTPKQSEARITASPVKNRIAAESEKSKGKAVTVALPEESDEDHWRLYSLPVTAKWLCATKDGLYCGGAKSTVYYTSTKEGRICWVKQNYQAIKFSVSLFSNILWKLDLGVAYAFLRNSPSGPWKIAARNVESIAVNENSAWYVSNGEIYVQTGLSRENPFNENDIKVDCPKAVAKVCCFGRTVWALTRDSKILSKCQKTNEEITWKLISYPENIAIVDISLGCKNTGWIVSRNNEIYFTNNFMSSEAPNWWQIISDNCALKRNSKITAHLSKLVQWSKDKVVSIVTTDDTAVWINQSSDTFVKMNSEAVEGYRWKELPMYELSFTPKWRYICASGATEDTTSIWALVNNNDLFMFLPANGKIRAVDAPTNDKIVCLTAIPGMLWVLSETGDIYVRLGITKDVPFGSLWSEIQFRDANDEQMKFKHLSFAFDVLWAVGLDGEIYAAEGHPCALANDFSSLDWIHVTDPSSVDVAFSEVIVGSNMRMVWALDNKCNIYVRQAIFDDFSFGTEWIFVSGIRAVHLAVSATAVWALTAEGHVYRRFGISQMNYIGDYWLQIPGYLSLITASVNEGLWGISKVDSAFTMYEKNILNLREETSSRRVSETLDDDWEFV